MFFFLCRDGQEPTETLHTMLQLIRTMEWKQITLSEVLVETFLPETYQKYLFTPHAHAHVQQG